MAYALIYTFYLVLGILIGSAITNGWWHSKMKQGYKELSEMSADKHIPTAAEVNEVFGGRR